VSAAEATEPPAEARGRSRWRRRLAIAAAVLVLLSVAFRVALPYAVERAVPKVAGSLGFDAHVANVSFGLLRGQVSIEGLRVAPLAKPGAPPSADLLRLGRLFVDLEWGALFHREIRIAELALEAPELRLVRAADGYIELPVLPAAAAPAPPAAPPPAPEKPSEPLPVFVQSLSIRNTTFHLADATGGADLVQFALKELGFTDLHLAGAKVGLGGIRVSEPVLRVRREVQSTKPGARGQAAASAPAGAPPELRIGDLEIERAEFDVLTDGEPVKVALHLKTSDVSLAPDAPFPLDLALEVGEGSLALQGKLGLDPVVWDGKVSWRGLAVPLLVRAALPELIPWIRSCRASGDLDVKLRLAAGGGAAPGLHASGNVGVDDFVVEDPERELALGWKSLAIELEAASVPLAGGSEPIEVAVGKIALAEPSARYVLPNTALQRLQESSGAGGTPAGEAAAPASASAPAGPEAPAPGAAPPPPHIRIDRIEVRGGSAEFEDRSGKEPYQGSVRDLSVDATGVRLPERTIERLRVRGIAPERAPFDLVAALPGAKGNVTFKLERLPLAQFTPYAESAADLRIPRGELSLDTKGSLANSGAAGKVETQVVVHQLSIDAGPSAISVAGMPLDLALALLRDPRGDIRLPIPLEYGEHGASVGIGAILVGALSDAIAGAVTSPIKAVGALLPSGGSSQVSFDPIPFAPGSAEAPPDAPERIGPLATLLDQRPGLGLELVGKAGPDDRRTLAEQILIERVAAGRGLPDVKDAGFFARRRIQGALEARGRGEPGALDAEDEALFGRYLEATDVPPERYAALARRRAEAIRASFVAGRGLDAARFAPAASAELGPAEVIVALRVAPAQEGESATP